MTDGEVPRDQVRDWLLQQGYPFEMAVARELRTSGFAITQGAFYRDPASDKAREIDIIAERSMAIEDLRRIEISVVVECKFAQSPWVVFVDGTRYGEERPEFKRITNPIGAQWLYKVQFDGTAQELRFLQLRPRPGYSMTTARLGPKQRPSDADAAYAAMMSVTKAAKALADERDDTSCAVIFPVIAVRGQLFEAWLDSENELQVESVDRHSIEWREPGAEGPVFVDVVSEAALPRFCAEAWAAGDFLATSTGDAARQAWRDSIGVY